MYEMCLVCRLSVHAPKETWFSSQILLSHIYVKFYLLRPGLVPKKPGVLLHKCYIPFHSVIKRLGQIQSGLCLGLGGKPELSYLILISFDCFIMNSISTFDLICLWIPHTPSLNLHHTMDLW